MCEYDPKDWLELVLSKHRSRNGDARARAANVQEPEAGQPRLLRPCVRQGEHVGSSSLRDQYCPFHVNVHADAPRSCRVACTRSEPGPWLRWSYKFWRKMAFGSGGRLGGTLMLCSRRPPTFESLGLQEQRTGSESLNRLHTADGPSRTPQQLVDSDLHSEEPRNHHACGTFRLL